MTMASESLSGHTLTLHGAGSLDTGGAVSLSSYVLHEDTLFRQTSSSTSSMPGMGTFTNWSQNQTTVTRDLSLASATSASGTRTQVDSSSWTSTPSEGQPTSGGSSNTNTYPETVTNPIPPPSNPVQAALTLAQGGAAPVLARVLAAPSSVADGRFAVARITGAIAEMLGGSIGLSGDPAQVFGGNAVNGVASDLLGAANKPAKLVGADMVTELGNFGKSLRDALGMAAWGGAYSPDTGGVGQGLSESALHSREGLAKATGKEAGARETVEARVEVMREQVPADLGPTPPKPPPTPLTGDGLTDATNFFAGWSDMLTMGLTARIRVGLGIDDVVDVKGQEPLRG
jgi:hypothetical protein